LHRHRRIQPHARDSRHQRALHRATNPSDQNVALTALEATLHVQGPHGERTIPIADFYLLPGATPQRETVLQPGDVITAVTLPPPPAGAKQVYLKLRDRAAYEFALSSAAVVATLDGNRIQRVRIALGGALEVFGRGFAAFERAAADALKGARPQSQNGFKVELAQRCLVRALTTATRNA
jgi:xanthine dehydrogenase YagS FAD-binding subunit